LNKNAIHEFFATSRKAIFAQRSPSRRVGHSGDALATEELFETLLCRERKRSERSGGSLVLMLIRAIDPREPEQEALLRRAAAVAAQNCRETDIAGWYQQGAVVGVLFTELGSASLDIAAKFIEDKMVASLSSALTDFNLLHISFYVFPEEFDGNNKRRESEFSLYPDYQQVARKKRPQLVVKRIIDVAGSAIALLLLSPVFLLIAIAIKCTSRGPMLFAQERIGQYGVRFRFLKFRSMVVSGDASIHEEFVKAFIAGTNSGQVASGTQRVFKITKDPRVTSVGRFLRRTSLDELPQLWNVLRGEMSLVGPRPPVRYELDAYQTWHRRRLFECKPGITGLWQVRGRSRTTFDEMVRLDLRYFRNWSLALDFRILLATPRAVFSGDGAY
jgi:exopolysaccharide biosynthesis polyprenyl glycosylphosphotransferase